MSVLHEALHADNKDFAAQLPLETETQRATLPAVIPPKPKDAPEAPPDDFCWSVPHQNRIECSPTMDDEIEIEQLSPLGESENTRIFVTRSNAVQLARSILYAAGFKGVLIATTDGGGGYSDVEDGGLPEHFRGAA
jgi:hypothetical protein